MPGGGGVRISLDRAGHPSRHDALAWRALRWELPELPELSPDAPRRWDPDPDWTPAGSLLLARHVSYSSEHRVHSNRLTPPRGYRLESVVGLVHNDPLPSTRRLTVEGDVLSVDEALEEPPVEQLPLGHAEQLPYVGLVALELWRIPATGQEVLVGDPADPLRGKANFVRHAGFVETLPVSPPGAPELPGRWGMRVLTRRLDRDRSRHVYALEAPDAQREPGVARLGGVWHSPGPGLIEVTVAPAAPAREGRFAGRSRRCAGRARSGARGRRWRARRGCGGWARERPRTNSSATCAASLRRGGASCSAPCIP